MINIQFNGNAKSIDSNQALSTLLEGQDDLPDNFAIAVNETFVPRTSYDCTVIQAGDQIELLIPMQGG